jgi:hypothetical protein
MHARTVGLAIVIALLASCLFHCDDRVTGEARSPDGEWIAAVYERDCGATTAISVNVNIRPTSARFDASKFEPVFVVAGPAGVSLEWQDVNHLVVSCPVDGAPYRSLDQWRHVSIQYVHRR